MDLDPTITMNGGMGRGPGMATSTATVLFFFFFFFLLLLEPSAAAIKSERLRVGFYGSTCPNAEAMVRTTLANYFDLNPAIAAGIIRLFFNDCFVRGCDASILLDETPSGEPVEKESPANGNTLKGLDEIDEVKMQVEAECADTVSCADILAFAARDAAVFAGLPHYEVPSGRRDGTVSLKSEALDNIPSPSSTITALTRMFSQKGLNQTEMAILSGAHSIGGSHCASFSYRLDDPLMDPTLSTALKMLCPDKDSDTKVEFDQASPNQLDASYFKAVVEGRGLLGSDQVLMTDRKTRRVVKKMAKRPGLWKKEFTKAMLKLSTVDVLVGEEGEVRRSCRFVN